MKSQRHAPKSQKPSLKSNIASSHLTIDKALSRDKKITTTLEAIKMIYDRNNQEKDRTQAFDLDKQLKKMKDELEIEDNILKDIKDTVQQSEQFMSKHELGKIKNQEIIQFEEDEIKPLQMTILRDGQFIKKHLSYEEEMQISWENQDPENDNQYIIAELPSKRL